MISSAKLFSTALCGLLAVGLGGFACGTTRTTETADADADEKPIRVTGTRLPRTNPVTSSPVRVYTRDRLDGTGMSRVGTSLGRGPSDALVRKKDLENKEPAAARDEVRPELKQLEVIDPDDRDSDER